MRKFTGWRPFISVVVLVSLWGHAAGGESNDGPAKAVVSNLRFSHERGLYDTAFDLTIACTTPGAEIYYTTDGSSPYLQSEHRPTGTLYTRPIRITRTTCLRAIEVLKGKNEVAKEDVPKEDVAKKKDAKTKDTKKKDAKKQGGGSIPVLTHTYIFPANVAQQQQALPAGFPQDCEMDPKILSNPQYGSKLQAALKSLPSMSIVMNTQDLFGGAGIYTNVNAKGISSERPASIELIHPDGAKGFQADCGVRIQGGYFRADHVSKKHSFRLLFKEIYGPEKLQYPLFGDDAAQKFNTVTLRACSADSYAGEMSNAQFTRDQFVRDLQLGTGNAAPHGIFVHLYLNGVYWGLYNPCERPDANFSSSYYGGKTEDWDAIKHEGFTVQQGDSIALKQMLSLCEEAGRSYEALMKLQGKGLDGQRRPEYPCLLDLANYVDYIIVQTWGGNWDWPFKNYWIGRDRTAASTGFKFYCWDVEDTVLSRRSPLDFNQLKRGELHRDVAIPHSRLKENPEYRLFFADRVHRLFFNGGILTPDSLIARYKHMANGIELAIIPEAARWADQRCEARKPETPPATPSDWIPMRDRILTTYLPQRTGVVLGQLRALGLYPGLDAPVFHVDGKPQHGGPVASSQRLTISGNVVYYTLDGSDPRIAGSAAGGKDPAGVSPTALRSSGPITLDKTTRVKARTLDGANWSALNEAVFAVGPVAQNLRISEILYQPASKDSKAEFVELTNVGSQGINLNLARFAKGIAFTFPSFELAPGGYCLLVQDRAAFEAVHGNKLPVVGQYTGSLDNAGEKLELLDAAGQVIQSFTYEGDWFDSTDKLGFSLTMRDPRTGDPGSKSAWQPSAQAGGSPGRK